LDYAMSVIVARALPDVKDGLKPVHRRILYAMSSLNLGPSARFVKSAQVVGEVLGKFHPHGDMSVYDSMVRMAQDFSMRYPLIWGQGNFGSVDGDPPAAMRYTEAKLKPISLEMLADINKNTVDFVDNFDRSLKEPVYLPAKLPNLLLMGSEGIAVGVATKIPPHNLTELVGALCFMIDKIKVEIIEDETGKKREKLNFEGTIDDLLKYIAGPDFPTGGAIFDADEIKLAYTTGKGKIVMRGKTNIEEIKAGKMAIIINELPYQVNKANLVAKIALLAKEKKIVGISDLRDESDRDGIRIVIELKRDAKPKRVLNNLFVKTPLQTTFAANIVALVNGTPQTLNLRTILMEYLKHRYEVIVRRSKYELAQAQARAHILEGLKIAVDNIDEVIEVIKRAKDVERARAALMEKFKLTEIQAQAILDMQLKRLAALERQKIEEEYQMIKETIDYLEDLLSRPEKILKVIKNELTYLAKKYGDERKTKVFAQKAGEFAEEDLITKEDVIITITKSGYIKRVPRGTFRSQRRGGKGVSGMKTKTEDEIAFLLEANTHDNILFLTDRGKVFQVKVWDLPEGSRISKGQAVINLINIEQGEKVQSVIAIDAKEGKKSNLVLATKKGAVKKTPLSAYANIRINGIIAIKLTAGDELCWAKLTTGSDHVFLATHNGLSIRFSEKDIRPTARDTMGVRGIRLGKGDYVVGMETFAKRFKPAGDKRRKYFKEILVVMENGIGKRTQTNQFPVQKRGGKGVKIANVTGKTGKVVCCRMVDEKVMELILTSRSAQVIKLPLKNIPTLKRATQGVILMRMGKLDKIAAVACLEKQ